MLKVGIQEKVFISKVTKNDKGTLVLGFGQVGVAGADPLAAFNDVNLAGEEGADILVYSFKNTNFDGELDTAENNQKKIKELKNQLDAILLLYLTQDKIRWDIFEGTGITADNINQKLTSQDVLDRVYQNMVTQFTKMMKPFVNRKDLLFRWLFIRQSAAKHYIGLRKRYLDTNPFAEPMSITPAESKLKFTKYEIEKGLNNPDPVSSDPSQANTSGDEISSSVDSVFAR